MPIFNSLKQAAKKVTGRQPRILTVSNARYLTPQMIRDTFAGPELADFPEGREGGNCKLMIPQPGEKRQDFIQRLADGPAPVKRTYTVRKFDKKTQELTIDFVAHGDNGPASRWAMLAVPGDYIGFAGPSTPKVTRFDADWYLLAADPCAIPVVAATLEAMPRDAQGITIFEVPSDADKQEIDAPDGIEMDWLIHENPLQASTAQEALIREIKWPAGRVQTCIAGESGVIKSLRQFLVKEKQLPRPDMYISGYWKIGLVEDEHQKLKRKEAN